jgi:hypothetical protein
MPASIGPAPHHADPVRTEGMRRKEYLGSATIRLEKSKPAVRANEPYEPSKTADRSQGRPYHTWGAIAVHLNLPRRKDPPA